MSPRVFFTSMCLSFAVVLGLEDITDPPRYVCPVDPRVFHPCVCDAGGDHGLFVSCRKTNVAALSLVFKLVDSPLDVLLIEKCETKRLFGPLFAHLKVNKLSINDSGLLSLDSSIFHQLGITELKLANNQLDQVPSDAIGRLHSATLLDLSGNQLTALTTRGFVGLRSLGELFLHDNLIDTLQVGAFTGLPALKRLDLHGNHIKEIAPNVFKELRPLTSLDLSHNQLVKLQASYFVDLASLVFLNVSHNEIDTWAANTFARSAALRWLSVSHNRLVKVESAMFKGMRPINRLYLSDNLIESVERAAFSNSPRLRTIDLARNQLRQVPFNTFIKMQFCDEIDLSENFIEAIDAGSFKELNEMVLNLSYNGLKTIAGGAFQDLISLDVLDLSHNAIETIPRNACMNADAKIVNVSHNLITNLLDVPYRSMDGIKVINASYNQIDLIPKDAFPKLYELHTVDLSHNRISKIENAVLQPLFGIRYINLSYNDLTTIEAATVGTVPTLLELDLSRNNISNLNRQAFTKLVSIRTLYLDHNAITSVVEVPVSLGELHLKHNKIEKIPANSFPFMNSLLQLHLDHNLLADNLEGGSFEHLLTVRHLGLTHNNMSHIPRDALRDMPSLQYLHLSHNHLTYIDKAAFGTLPVVFELWVDFNNITSFSPNAFDGMLQLLMLNASYNVIRHIPPGAFKGLVALRELDLSHNELTKLENKTHGVLADLLSIDKVNLSYNDFAFVSKRLFPYHRYIPFKLQYIDMSYNAIPVITAEAVDGWKKAKVIILHHNLLTEIQVGVLVNLTQLQVLDLSENQLSKRLPIGTLRPPRSLLQLNLRHNQLDEWPVSDWNDSSTHLSHLDLRDNRMENVSTQQLLSLLETGAQVLLTGNPIICDCRLRPLTTWLSKQLDVKYWDQLQCESPLHLKNSSFIQMSEEELSCSEKDPWRKFYPYSMHVQVHSVQKVGPRSARIAWYMVTAEDVGGFRVAIRKPPNGTLDQAIDVPYDTREQVVRGLDPDLQYTLCVMTRSSDGQLNLGHAANCRPLGPLSSAVHVSGLKILLLLPVVVFFSLDFMIRERNTWV